MKRYILTGTPGAGKTAILRALELEGVDVVEEAATDVIALEQARGVPEPWTEAGFLAAIVELQRRREAAAAARPVEAQVHDRSAVCTLALARLLERPIPEVLSRELDRIIREGTFRRRVLFVENLGLVAPTAARRITYEDALAFERLHEQAYLELGYDLVRIPAAPLAERLAAVRSAISAGA